jgi:predicted TIM-barrel fold metal-dependent hydrolase
MYRYDASYVLEVEAKHPDRFCLVKPVDPNDPAVADIIADWKAKKGTVGVRILMRDNVSTDPADPGINRVLAAAAKASMAVNLLCSGRLEQAGQLAARNPNTRLVIDHLGLQQPLEPPPPAQPWAELPKVLAPAHCRTSRSRTKTSGTRSAASSTPLASTAACGAPTGHAPSNC